jgi:hypothetical protein
MAVPASRRVPRPSTRRRATLLLATASLGIAAWAGPAACGGRGRRVGEADLAPTTATTVRVRNQSFLDHAIYVVNAGARARIGTVTGNTTSILRIPPGFVQPGALLRFMADPIGSNVTPVSDQLVVSPGDEVTLIIPPR